MQKQLIHGIPYFVDNKSLYLWDSSSTPIGTYEKDTITFKPDLLPSLSEKLAIWRAEQQSRVRKPTNTSARRGRNNKSREQNVEDDV